MSLPSGLPDQVADTEFLSRFLTSSGHFNASAVKPAAFLPNPNDGRTSVFRHGAEPIHALERIGREEVAKERELHGVGVIMAEKVRATKLEIEASEPPLRHADITRWPWMRDDREFGKAERKEIALFLAQNAQLIRFA